LSGDTGKCMISAMLSEDRGLNISGEDLILVAGIVFSIWIGYLDGDHLFLQAFGKKPEVCYYA
jgi:hypothetical protein